MISPYCNRSHNLDEEVNMLEMIVVSSLFLLCLFAIFALAIKRSLWIFSPKSKNPFSIDDARKELQPLVKDREKRDKVLKQSFSTEKIPENLDAIVIGSGIGGLTVAAVLSRAGKRVLVLEQHDQAGGCCHTYIEKGFEFDVGIHYVGGMSDDKPSTSKILLDQISDCQIKWHPLSDNFDTVKIGNLNGSQKSFDIYANPDRFVRYLTVYFPGEEKAIKKYLKMVKDVRSGVTMFGLVKLLPQWLVRILSWTRLIYYTKFYELSELSLQDVLNEVTDNELLKTVLAYNFGDYGTLPKDTSFVMHALLTDHFMNGSYYPVGGASEIAFHIIPVIERGGGRVLVRAPVTNILFDDNNTRVTGVTVKRGNQLVEVRAPLVISDAGMMNTYNKLLPREVVEKYQLGANLKQVQNGVGALSLFVGLKGGHEELEVKMASNIWAFTDYDINDTIAKYVNGTPEDAEEKGVPLLFISFPSTKDPTWEERYPGKTTCVVITLTPFEWFKTWEENKVLHRGQDYDSLKTVLGKRIWSQVLEMYPQLEDKVEYFEVGTPLSNQFYIASPKGEIYGCDHNKERFSPITTAMMRPDTPIPGLYLTGQDVSTCGLSGAMQGGIMTSTVILKRNLMEDLVAIRKKLVKSSKKQE